MNKVPEHTVVSYPARLLTASHVRTALTRYHVLGAALIVLTSLLVALFLAIVLYQIVFLERIFIGVRALGIELGGMTRSQAFVTLATRSDSFLNFPVVLRYEGKTWVVSVRQVGAVLDIPQAVAHAYAFGRRGDLIGNILDQLRALFFGVEINPVVRYDSGPANALLAEIARQINRPARDAELIIQPDLTMLTLPAQNGLSVDIDATRSLVHQRALTRDLTPVELVVHETPPAIVEIEPAYQIVQTLLSAPLVLSVALPERRVERVIPPDELLSMLIIQEEANQDGTGRIVVTFDLDKWKSYLNDFAREVNRAPLDARFQVDPQNGSISVIRPSQEGYQLDVERSLTLITELINRPAHHLELPLLVIPPAVRSDAANQIYFGDIVAEATTTFKGSSEARVRNIQVAASKFHGIVVPPGALFSFNAYLGPITAEEGYERSLIIWGDRTAVGIGGGICQVSTTLFRAAFFGGFEIVERWAHGYRVSWYEIEFGPGLDATIYAPNIDFKFRNDTEHFLLIQSYVDQEAGTLTFRFYGTRTQRQVAVEGPLVEEVTSPGAPEYRQDPSLPKGTVKQVEWPREGAKVTVRRTVTQNGIVLHQDELVSRYRPWHAVYLVGTGEGG
ncbi:MAG: VanW family protein [Anaerolineae bacterium]|nr:VanW family protein [Anaerolineae bacterium]MDW8070258.1 VanW family protein [Anaerolineae bacterium]